ncbi:hypothetical protein H0H81_002946 [Sphagnurus paluster]|uniref:Flavin reductase like domain-containing protein n=1 Tax=Sphagnurus paluster TaxID=117069 RepID=A0A9P7FW26_9AGAR|nr:hypothetical protein H0H81_002946 [Sphagnurus paluster]
MSSFVLPPFDTNGSFSVTTSPNPAWKIGDGVIDKEWREKGEESRKSWDMDSTSPQLTPARTKDSRENILANKQFTVNIISEPMAEAANASSVEAPADVDEWILSGLTMVPSTHVKPSYVKESAVSMECELYSFQDISPPNSTEITTTLVLGLVKKVHIRKSVLDESGTAVDPSKLRPVARLGNRSYSRLLDVFDLPRIPWETVIEGYEDLKAKASANAE